jgi:hypothetical protein
MNAKGSLVMDVVLNINLEIGNQKMVANTILLDLNHIKIQHLHVEFFSLIKHFLISWITMNRG